MLPVVHSLLHHRYHFGRRVTTFAQSSSTLYSGNANSYSLYLSIPDPSTCEEIGALISAFAAPPDVLLLDGDLGAGKTTFSRGFIRNKLGVKNEAITSPTYLLSNAYSYKSKETVHEIRHMDLYRLSGSHSDEFSPLDLNFVFSKCISLIEWPSRLPKELQPPSKCRLNINMSIIPSTEEREMVLSAPLESTWCDRLRNVVGDGFVDDLLLHCTDRGNK